MVLVSALNYNLKFHYVCFYFNSLKSFGGDERGDRKNLREITSIALFFFFFFTIVKCKCSLILSSWTNIPDITNNQIDFMVFL